MEYYHAYTKGLKRNLLFSSDEDFIYGMNLIPKSLKGTGVVLLAFCLMDNHLHFILKSTRDKCNGFIVKYKKSLGSFLARNGRRIREDLEAGVSRIGTSDYLMTSIAYVLRNPMVAGTNYIPQDYRWSSASIYFRRQARIGAVGQRALGTLSYKDKRVVLKGRCDFPDDWLLDEEGMILPECYTAVAEVEGLFSSVGRYLYHISANREAEVNGAVSGKVRLSDSDLKKEAVKMCLNMFGTASVNMLDHGQRLLVCKSLRKEFGAAANQLARVMDIDAEYLKMLM